MALRTVERRRLAEQVFLEELGGHVNFARALAAALSPTPLHGVQGAATQ